MQLIRHLRFVLAVLCLLVAVPAVANSDISASAGLAAAHADCAVMASADHAEAPADARIGPAAALPTVDDGEPPRSSLAIPPGEAHAPSRPAFAAVLHSGCAGARLERPPKRA